MNNVLPAEIKTQLSKILGQNIQIFSCEPLNVGATYWVDRIKLEGTRQNFTSLIVKYVNPTNLNFNNEQIETKAEYIEERFNYIFLSKIRDFFPLFPKLIAEDQNLLILEDLGESEYSEPPDQSILKNLATVVAKLHAATANQYPLFQQMRKEANLDDIDRRMYSKDYYDILFATGAIQINWYCDFLNIKRQNYEILINQIQDTISNPEVFHAFIHHDLVSPRQFVYVKNQVYLIDFEHAQYSHAFLDIAKILVGSIEWNRKEEVYFINHPNFPREILDIYRLEYSKYREIEFDDKVWEMNLSSALIHSTLSVLGELFKIPSDLKPRESIEANIKLLIDRLIYLLEGNDYHQELKEILNTLNSRIVYV
ncbi:aminoglycoside phosphotransferase [Cylindrospermum stagnale PCC 7417]|uniref:Aminoglycoside phosphotransferase n=1 Tax=Cylindrospermum stagnale PCC 7417 TaxID=56107 RepID=K9X359_9NOST|nr:phosphotransferase [Cylindrospermum stagnale]AFZ26122.1 aminoglycoside phosphotransferase [Cylindrospermum stagnale PCC 7417]